MKLINGDCLEEMKSIPDGSVDLVLTDPPYGTITNLYKNTDWDVVIDIVLMMKSINRILRKGGKLILFAQEPFTNEIRNKALPNIQFNQRLIWEKNSSGNMLFAKKAPVNFYEDILVFTRVYDLEFVTPRNPTFEYFKKCKEISGITTKEYNHLYCDYKGKTKNRDRGQVARCWETSQFWFPSKDIYENVLQPTGFFTEKWEVLKQEYDDFSSKYKQIFNLWEGNKYKSNILKYKKDNKRYHPTQKPVALMKDLINTYTNENDIVLDFTMGSGTTGVACKNLNRDFIGIELDEEYFKIAKARIFNTIKQSI